MHGWSHWRARRPRALSPGDWVRLLLFMTGVLAVLALGPVIVDGERVGLYAAVHAIFPPLRAVSILVRFGIICIAGVALLAALGLRAVKESPARPARWWRGVLIAVTAGLVAEYAVKPIRRAAAALAHPVRGRRAARRSGGRRGAGVAGLVRRTCSRAMVQSLVHGKRVINGYSGFTPELVHDVADLLIRPGPAAPETQAILRQIYPLRYLVVRHRAVRSPPQRPRSGWRSGGTLRRPVPLPGAYGSEDLYAAHAHPGCGV